MLLIVYRKIASIMFLWITLGNQYQAEYKSYTTRSRWGSDSENTLRWSQRATASQQLIIRHDCTTRALTYGRACINDPSSDPFDPIDMVHLAMTTAGLLTGWHLKRLLICCLWWSLDFCFGAEEKPPWGARIEPEIGHVKTWLFESTKNESNSKLHHVMVFYFVNCFLSRAKKKTLKTILKVILIPTSTLGLLNPMVTFRKDLIQ